MRILTSGIFHPHEIGISRYSVIEDLPLQLHLTLCYACFICFFFNKKSLAFPQT